MLDLRRLRVLREVALRGSFSAAATELVFSPSAVSQQIAQLEREVGARLVDRRSSGIQLTQAGRLLLAHANAILARAADAEEEMRRLSDGTVGTLRVGAFATATAALMPEVIPAFRSLQPGAEILLIEQDRSECLAGLQEGELDLAVLVRPPEPSRDGIEEMPLVDDRLDVLLPRDHRLAAAPAVTLEELRDEPWADCSGGPVRRYMGAIGVEPTIVFVTHHPRVLEGIVAAGVAVGLVPRLAQPVDRRDIVVKPVAPDPPVRPVGLALRADEQRSAVLMVVDLLRRAVASRARGEHPAPTWPRAARPGSDDERVSEQSR